MDLYIVLNLSNEVFSLLASELRNDLLPGATYSRRRGNLKLYVFLKTEHMRRLILPFFSGLTQLASMRT